MTSRNFSIVMADDDLDDQYLVRRAIEEINMQHQFTSVNNGSQLLDLLQQKGTFAATLPTHPDCILLDLNMPMMDGFSTLASLKASQDLAHIPVFIFSTTRNPRDRERSLSMGAVDFFVKPTQYAELKHIILSICGKVNSEQALL